MTMAGGGLGLGFGDAQLLDRYSRWRSIDTLLIAVSTDGLNRLLTALSLPTVEINGFFAAVAVLGFVQGAYMTEVLRGAAQSRNVLSAVVAELAARRIAVAFGPS